jgi:group I intron endonuclease
MKISGIYQIQSKIKPERIYIGSAVSIHRRWGDHLSLLKKQKHENARLQNHYNKYGKNDLVFSILIGCAKDDLIITEQFYIDSKKCWFNLCQKAGSTFGLKHTDQSRENNRLARLGVKHSVEHNESIAKAQTGENNSFFGKHHSEESNRKRREWNLLHPRTPEMIEKQRQSLIKTYEKRKFELMNQN